MSRVKIVAPTRQPDDPNQSPLSERDMRDGSISPARQLTQLSQAPICTTTSSSAPRSHYAPIGTPLQQVKDRIAGASPPDIHQISYGFHPRHPNTCDLLNLNNYAEPEFFQKYSDTSGEVCGLLGAREWPVLITLIPDIMGKSFLDLGCGSGAVCRWALENGVGMVKGFDSSELMLSKACTFPPDSRLQYLCANLELSMMLQPVFDFVFSSLTIHYIANFRPLFREVFNSLKPGGRFVFSVNHPASLGGSLNPVIKQKFEKWPMDSYLLDGPRAVSWTGDSIRMQHRSIATYVNTLIETGFVLERIHEWGELEAPESIKDPKGFWPVSLFFRVLKPVKNAEEVNNFRIS